MRTSKLSAQYLSTWLHLWALILSCRWLHFTDPKTMWKMSNNHWIKHRQHRVYLPSWVWDMQILHLACPWTSLGCSHLNKCVSLRSKAPNGRHQWNRDRLHHRNPQHGKRPEIQLLLEFYFEPSSLGMDHNYNKKMQRTSQWVEVKRSPCLEPFSRLINPGPKRISQCCWAPGSLFYNIWLLQFSCLKQLVFKIPAKAVFSPFNVPCCYIPSFSQPVVPRQGKGYSAFKRLSVRCISWSLAPVGTM